MGRTNIVLIGFMGTGKTTIGKILSRRTKYKFIDTDNFIEEKANMDIKAIFELKGEEYFRDLEREAILEVSECSGVVIACGGGVVKDKENVEALRKNGVIVCLKADIDTIIERIGRNNNRPLASGKSRDDIVRLLNERRPLYNNADVIIDTSKKGPLYIANRIIHICRNYIKE